MSGTLVAYTASGDIIGTLDSMLGLDFASEDNADIWVVSGAKGSKVWPDRIEHPQGLRVELAGPAGQKHIAALVNRANGRRLERRT